MVKDVILRNGAKHNAFMYVIHSTAQDIFNLLKCPDPSYLLLKICNIFLVNNRVVAQNVILQWL